MIAIIALFVLIVLTPLAIYLARNPEDAAAWWDSSFAFRKQLTFGNSGSATTDEIVSFSVDTATLISEGKMQTDCDDIRFTDVSGQVLEHRINGNFGINYGDDATEYSSSTTQSSYSFSHTVTDADNQVLVVIVHGQNDQSGSDPINVDSVTFNGDSMTKQIEVDQNHPTTTNRDKVTSVFTLINPDAGTYNVSVTLDGNTDDHLATAMTFSGVDQSTPVGVTASNTSTSTYSLSVTGTTTYDNSYLVGGAIIRSSSKEDDSYILAHSPAKQTYQSSTGLNDTSISSSGGFQFAENDGSQTMTFGLNDNTNAQQMVGAFIELKPATSSTACNSATTDLEVLFPNIATSDNVAYMYYGNPAADDATSDLVDSSKPASYVEVTDSSQGASTDTHNFSHTVSSGNNQKLVVILSGLDSQTGDSPLQAIEVTYDDIPLVRHELSHSYEVNRNIVTEIWSLNDPPTGSNTISVTFSESNNVQAAAALTFRNIKQNYLQDYAVNEDTSRATTFDVDITTTTNNNLLVGGAGRETTSGGSVTIDMDSPATTDYQQSDSYSTYAYLDIAGGHQSAATAGSHTLGFSTTSARQWTGVALALEPESTYDEFSPTSGPTTGSEQLSPSPILHFMLDEGADNTCSGGVNDACDSSGQGHDGAFGASTAAPSWQPESMCVLGKCLSFDGSDDVITVTNTSMLDFDKVLKSGFSLSFWVKPVSDGEADTGEIVDKGSHLYCRTDSQSGDKVDLECSIDLATTDATVNVVGGLTIGNWHHVTVTYADDGDDDLLVYIDGKLRGTGDGSGAPVGTDTSNLSIGGDSSHNFHGFLDEFKVYPYERDADQVKSDAIVGAGPKGSNAVLGLDSNDPTNQGLLGYWKLDEASGNPVDSSGFGNTLTNNGTTTFVTGKFASGSEHIPASSQYFSTASTINGVKSVSLWVNPDSTTNYLLSLTSGAYLTVSSGTLSTTGITNPIIYVNGVASTTLVADTWQLVTITTDTAINANQLYVGRVGANYFDGTLDEVRLYNRSLSPAEVQSLYHWAPGPVGYWPMDEGTGTTTTYDKSGNSNNGTLNGTMTADDWIPGKFGTALEFDGTDDNIQISDNSILDMGAGASFSIQGWFKHDAISTNPDYILTKSQAGTNGGYQIYMNASGQIVMEVDDDSTWGPDDSISTPQPPGISFVAAANAKPSTGDSVTPAIPTGSTTDDLMIAICSRGGNYGTASWLDDGGGGNGWTRLVTNFTATGRDEVSAIFYKIHDGSESDPTFSLSDASNAGGAVVISTYRGVDTSTPFDVTYNNTNHYLFSENDGNPASPDITTNTDGAFVVLLLGASQRAGDWGAPTGYTLDSLANTGDSYDRYAGMVYKEITSAGTENPGVWNNVDIYFTAETHAYTLAIKPAALTGVPYDDNQWHHFSAVRDGTTDYYMYIDGVQVSTEPTVNATGSLANDDPVYIGVDDDASSNDWAGALDDIKIYNYARIPSQVIEDMNASHPVGGSPVGSYVAYWSLDEMNGTTAQDSSINDNDLTLNSSSWTTSGKVSSAWNGTNATWMSRADDSDFDMSATDDYSATFWFKSDAASNPAGTEYLLNKANATTAGYAIYANTSGQVCFGIDDDTTWSPDVASCTTADVYDGTWHHISAVRDTTADKLLIYLDGILVDSDSDSTTATLENSLSLYVGDRDGTDNGDEFAGDIDEIKIYRAVLTADQAKIVHNTGSATTVSADMNERDNITDGDYLSSLVGYWPMDENTGASGGTVYDKSGSGNNGTLGTSMSETDWVPGKHGSALNFDETTNDKLDMGDVAAYDFGSSQDFTVTTWVRTTQSAAASNWPQIVGKEGDATRNGWLFNLHNDTSAGWFAQVYQGGTNYNTSSSVVDVADGDWHHLALVRNGSSLEAWTDGTLTNSVSVSTGSIANAQSLIIGTDTWAGSEYLGDIDDVKIFNTALTAAQIAYEYNRGKPIAYWQFDECQGSDIYDFSGLENHGTLTIGATGSNTSIGTCSSGTSTEAWNAGTTGKFSGALALDGTDDYMTVTDAATIRFNSSTQDLSLLTWVKHTESGVTDYIISKEDADNDGYRLQFNSDNTLTCSVDAIDITSSITITDTNWHHLACVIDRDGNGAIYIDGQLAGTPVAINSEAMGTTANLTIGTRSYSATNYFTGLIDDTRFYNYTLSPAQIKNVMNHGSVRF
jgi:hypothetical protein